VDDDLGGEAVKVFALQHRVCGHIAGLGNDRTLIEHKAEHLQAAGYHQWRVRLVEYETAAEQVLADEKCDACRIDPERGRLLLDAQGACRVCTANTH
jgi:hypothetical protein